MPAEHYYTPKPTSHITEQSFSQVVRGNELKWTTATGLFSLSQIDTGSLLLIDKGLVKPDWRILDLGCGYGPIGISFKKAEPTIRVTFTDVNTRAVEYAKKNLIANSIDADTTVEFVNGDGYGAVVGLFDAIYLNPPQSAGRELCLRLISQAREFLKPNGNLQIVARKNKGGATLAEHMRNEFGNVDALAKQSGFWIYISYKQ